MDPYLYSLRELPLGKREKREEVAGFLARHDLELDTSLEKYYGVFANDTLIGGIGYGGKILKCAAVDASFRGEGILAALVSRAMGDLHRRGVANVFVFTKPENRVFFAELAFQEVAETPQVLLMESMRHGFRHYLDGLPRSGGGVVGALVVNCNPFTLGHRHLIGCAARECDRVLVFVVEEDASEFSFIDRFRLVREGVLDLPDVSVVAGGDYCISAATFPTYFLKTPSLAAKAHMELDAGIFGRSIAPAAGISRRYVGEEPECVLTGMYNLALRTMLPPLGVEVREIPRAGLDGMSISASRVRTLFAEKGPEAVREMVPPSTYAFLAASAALPALEKIRRKLSGQESSASMRSTSSDTGTGLI